MLLQFETSISSFDDASHAKPSQRFIDLEEGLADESAVIHKFIYIVSFFQDGLMSSQRAADSVAKPSPRTVDSVAKLSLRF
jgi:hypothetical protein